MFDKQAQRQRALNQAQALMKQGFEAPKNPIPVVPVVPSGPKDMQGKIFRTGQKIIRPVKDGNSQGLRICTVTHVAGNQVYVDGSQRGLGRPDKCYILEEPKGVLYR